jgi:hypothetical protein
MSIYCRESINVQDCYNKTLHSSKLLQQTLDTPLNYNLTKLRLRLNTSSFEAEKGLGKTIDNIISRGDKPNI